MSETSLTFTARIGPTGKYLDRNSLIRAFASPELFDAKALDQPMLDRRYKKYRNGSGLPASIRLAEKIRADDSCVFITSENKLGIYPGPKNSTDHFLEK